VTNARVQVLIDASGSMIGFRRLIPHFAEWVSQSLSQVRTFGSEFTVLSACYFSAGRGIHDCQSSLSRSSGAALRGNTNLHEAVASAAGYDLGLILTDGVAATGGGDGDCAAGVDPACVARALRQALVPRPHEPQTLRPGLWMVPLVATFDGAFYTEQKLDPAAFATATVEKNVREEFGSEIHVEAKRPALDPSGRLVYHYQGPRVLFSLVLSRNPDLGRAFLAALYARSAALGIQRLGTVRDFRSGLAMLAPVEIYPGYMAPIEWDQAERAVRSYRIEMRGAVDHRFQPPHKVEIQCLGENNSVRLEVSVRPRSAEASCVDLHILPRTRIYHAVQGKFPVIQDDLLCWSAKDSRPESLKLWVNCKESWQESCGPGSSSIDWYAQPDFRESADVLARQSGADAPVIGGLTTLDAAGSPHRNFGLAQTFEKLYMEMVAAGAEVKIPIARLEVCKP
jgi:hypothetical protein